MAIAYVVDGLKQRARVLMADIERSELATNSILISHYHLMLYLVAVLMVLLSHLSLHFLFLDGFLL